MKFRHELKEDWSDYQQQYRDRDRLRAILISVWFPAPEPKGHHMHEINDMTRRLDAILADSAYDLIEISFKDSHQQFKDILLVVLAYEPVTTREPETVHGLQRVAA